MTYKEEEEQLSRLTPKQERVNETFFEKYQEHSPTPMYNQNPPRMQMLTLKVEFAPSKPFLECSNRAVDLLFTSGVPVFQLYVLMFKMGG